MMEIERKILDISPRELIKNISTLKPRAKKLFEGLVCIEYWDMPDFRVRRKKDLLRIREFFPKSGKKPYTEIVYKIYKGIKSGSKYFDETQFTIPGRATKELGKIFKRIGFIRTCVYQKRRTLYGYKDCYIEIDEHPRIPPFAEIEAPSPRVIDSMVNLLGLQKKEQSAESISELLRRKYPKIRLDGLVF